MKHNDILKRLRQNPEYVAAEEELKPILDIAADVVRLRSEKGWSQTELAERVGTRQANISRLENGLGNPTLSFLNKVAQALNTNLMVHIGPKLAPTPTVVIARQEVRTVQAETLWSGKRPQRTSPTRWVGFTPSARAFTDADAYEAA